MLNRNYSSVFVACILLVGLHVGLQFLNHLLPREKPTSLFAAAIGVTAFTLRDSRGGIWTIALGLGLVLLICVVIPNLGGGDIAIIASTVMLLFAMTALFGSSSTSNADKDDATERESNPAPPGGS
jgi:hypothetical protein